MRSKEEALATVLGAVPAPGLIEEVPLASALGRVLARDVASDMPMPPFRRSSMDGWGVRSEDVTAPGARLEITGRIMAGMFPDRAVGPGETMKVMTGAPVPDGADAVVMVEQSEEADDGTSVTLSAAARPGQNVCPVGEDLSEGEVVLRRGTGLDPAALGLLAMVGADPVPTFRAPTVAVIPTGDELVPASGPTPGPGMIRESNGVLLASQVRRVSPALRVERPGIARDTEASLHEFLDVGLDHDVLCLSGGVSMGDLDLVGNVLLERGLEVLIEKVSIKPGKPLLFGRVRAADGHVCHVFGLPGNPVSSYVTFELFVRPFLLRCLGTDDVAPDEVAARLAAERPLKAIPRAQHVPAVVRASESGLDVAPVTWHGSGDLRGLVDANGFVLVPAGGPAPVSGDLVRVHLIPGRGLREPAHRSRPADAP